MARRRGLRYIGAMADDLKLPVALEDRRQSIIDQLAELYANDGFDDEELERRLEAVERAEDVTALDRVMHDLVPAAPAVPAVAEPAAETCTALVPVAEVPQQRSVVAVFSGAKRKFELRRLGLRFGGRRRR